MKEFKGKMAVVTGGGAGMGREIAVSYTHLTLPTKA